ncbi:MAG: ABC transporter permease [Candidatus Cloacimonadales bacterium]
MAISIRENLVVGFSDFWSRKVRSLIVILGIVLGTMSIIVVTSIINGINKQTMAWMMERGGLAKISVQRNWEYDSNDNDKRFFDLKEFNQISSLIPEAKYISPEMRRYVNFSYQQKSGRYSIYGTTPDFTGIEEWQVAEGRFINNFDLKQNIDVIVLGSQIKEDLFGSRNAIGELVTVYNRRMRVIGLMEHRFMKGNMMQDNALSYLNRRAFIPLSTMINKGAGDDRIFTINIKAEDAAAAPALGEKLEDIVLNMRFGKPVFQVRTAAEEAAEMKKSTGVFQLVFTLISAISLFVGAIVISNIMLATIKERTREIGIRIAIGARRRDVFFQFLVQTVLVAVIGGILGVVTGVSLLNLFSGFLDMELFATTATIIMALLSSAFVGLLAGVIPAIIASRLDPIKALRYE